MKTLLLRVALCTALLAALPAATAFARETHDPAPAPAVTGAAAEATASENEIEPVAVWSFIVVLLLGGTGGVFYLLKKRLGGFPAHPAWTAPISIMRSKDLPDESTYGDVAPDAGHGGHH